MACSGSQALDEGARADQVLDGLHREVGVDRGGAVADEQRDVVHLADVAGLDQQAHLGALLGADEVVVDGGGEQQRGDRCVLGVGVPVGEHDQPGAVLDGGVGLGADLLQPGGEGRRRRRRPGRGRSSVAAFMPGMSPSALM